MSFKEELQQIERNKQNNRLLPNFNETASDIIAAGKERLCQAAILPESHRFIKTSFFGKKTLFRTVTNLYIAQGPNKNSQSKGHASALKYDNEIYGYQLYDLSDLNQLVSLITQGCKNDDIVVSLKKDGQGIYNLVFEITL